jgi:peptidoglycan/xylan/chitin deacetylase (PgdA/CDA1 family)
VTSISADRPFPILLYHSLTAEATSGYRPYAVDPARFREQMELVAAGGYRTLTIRDLVAAMDGPVGRAPARSVLITFDDGFDDVHREALPILAGLGLKATAFVVTGHLGGTSRWLAGDGEGDRRLLSWTQLRELASAGIEIGSHSHTHPQLDTISEARADEEIGRSRSLLEEGLQAAVTSFAYPHGYHTKAIMGQLRQHGYTAGCAVKNVLSHDADDRWSLGRAVVFDDTQTEALAAWLEGRGLPAAWSGERLQTTGWRLVRRATARVRQRKPSSVPTDST